MKMNNRFENVKSDSNTYGYNPLSETHNDPTEYQNVAERIEVASVICLSPRQPYWIFSLKMMTHLKDFTHIKETNRILLKNYKMMEKIRGKMETLSYYLKNFYKTIPSHIKVKLCEDDRDLIKSFMPNWKSML